MRKVLMLALGAIALVIGVVWTLQGADVIQGSPMTGQTMWLVIGIVLIVVGAALLGLGARVRRATRA